MPKAFELQEVFKRYPRGVQALSGLSLSGEAGQVVGLLGPNGAGKTTSLKVLSGLLHPTNGEVDVLGFTPWQRRRDFLSQITLVMGQRQQLYWDLPAIDTFLVNKAVFGLNERTYRQSLTRLSNLLELEDLLGKPVRQLSLGERMKVELAAGLLHQPRVLFLDEPTIGLDITMQQRIREFIREYNRSTGATVLLTSHYMADVKALAERVIVIDTGLLLYDGPLQGLVERYAPHKTIILHLESPLEDKVIRDYGEIVRSDLLQIEIRVPKGQAAFITARVLSELPVADLSVEDPPLEEIIEQVFRSGRERQV